MCNPSEFIPHREEHPIRHCSDCGAMLSTGNTMALCWPCGKCWGRFSEILYPTQKEDIVDAVERVLAA